MTLFILKKITIKLFIDVRWLSLGKATTRLFDLSDEVYTVIMEKALDNVATAKSFVEVVDDDTFWLGISYMSDIFTILNKSCIGMQGHNVTIFKVFIVLVFLC